MLAWQAIESAKCRCGQPVDIAHHPDMDGWFHVEEVTCWACTAIAQSERDTADPVTFPLVVDTRDHNAKPLPSLAEWDEWQRDLRGGDPTHPTPARTPAKPTTSTAKEASLG